MSNTENYISGVAHWSKDFVEHLRTVHFSLVILSLGLLLVVTAQREGKTSRAREQLEQIALVASQLQDSWVATLCIQRKKEFFAKSPPDSQSDNRVPPYAVQFDERLDQTAEFDISGLPKEKRRKIWTNPHPSVDFERSCTVASWVPRLGERVEREKVTVLGDHIVRTMDLGHSDLVQKPETLEGFRRLWDTLHRYGDIVVVTSLGQAAAFVDFSDDEATSFPYTVKKTNRIGDGRGLKLVTVSGEAQSTEELFEYSHESLSSHQGRLRVSVKSWRSIRLNGIAYLRELLPESVRLKWRDFVFAETFP